MSSSRRSSPYFEKTAYVRNSLPDEPSHIFEYWGLHTYRSLCEGAEVSRSYIYETELVSCQGCMRTYMREYEGGADLEDVKLSGLEPEMTEEEYRRLFNLGRTSNDLSTELVPHIADLTKTGKSFSEMTMEEKTDHIEFLNRCMRKIKIFRNSASLAKQEAMMELSEAERDQVRQYDKKYKPKPQVTEGVVKRSPSERKTMSPEDKLIEMLAKQLGSEEAARAFVEKQKKTKKD